MADPFDSLISGFEERLDKVDARQAIEICHGCTKDINGPFLKALACEMIREVKCSKCQRQLGTHNFKYDTTQTLYCMQCAETVR